jgi:GNAT superfamily N-acetyltransferase/anti-sigma regulatory factor (Ser/Thr protein kinase)
MPPGAADDLFIHSLTPVIEERIRRNPSLNIDTFIVPSPFVEDSTLELDYQHSYVWDEEGELLGYLLVYSNPDRTRYHLYKQVTSPFGRGKGVGSAFLSRLAREISPDALVYLYVWARQPETSIFYANNGFATEDRLVYRKLVFNRMSARGARIGGIREAVPADPTVAEEIGKARHDARKTLRLLSGMVDTLSVDNASTIIEGVNRETTALVNMLNDYRDAVEYFHEVDVKELILERILPLIDLSTVTCDVQLSLAPRVPQAYGHYVDVGRALVNLVSNSLDAIREAGRDGIIRFSLKERQGSIQLVIEDNGAGIDAEKLSPGPDGLPLFVGHTTKGSRTGEGIGTRQIYACFGAENISVQSERGAFTRWTIRMPKKPPAESAALRNLEGRYLEFQQLVEYPVVAARDNRPVLGSFIWQTRKMEILSWDLIFLFSTYSNIREIYRATIAYRCGQIEIESLKEEIEACRVDEPRVRDWLLDIVRMIRRNESFLARTIEFADYAGMLFKSYGQSESATIIFTLDPGTGRFHATDRKLAEHVDFAPYLGRERDTLLRGEFSGDVKNTGTPISLGVWSIRDAEDALCKLSLVRQGCRTLIGFGIKPEKRLAFYRTTYRQGPIDLDPDSSTTLQALADTPDAGLGRFLADTTEDEFPYVLTD